jgi:CheY-like chemotaxis protein
MPDSILVAEDERASGEYLKLLLEEMGFDVRLAGNGVEALLALEAGAFDLVVTDLRMPSMDGFELLTHLGQRWPDLPAIVLTANEDVSDVIDAIRLGAVNYLLKPAGDRSFKQRFSHHPY